MKFKNALAFAFFFAIVTLVIRFAPVQTNIACAGGLALFSACFLQGWIRWILPVSVLLITDLIGHFGNISDMGFYSLQTMLMVYLGYVPMMFLGGALRRIPQNQLVFATPAAALLGSCGFFLISNFGSWIDPMMGSTYPRTFAGLMECYAMGVPFFRNTCQSDVLASCAFFGVYGLYLYMDSQRETAPRSIRLD